MAVPVSVVGLTALNAFPGVGAGGWLEGVACHPARGPALVLTSELLGSVQCSCPGTAADLSLSLCPEGQSGPRDAH